MTASSSKPPSAMPDGPPEVASRGIRLWLWAAVLGLIIVILVAWRLTGFVEAPPMSASPRDQASNVLRGQIRQQWIVLKATTAPCDQAVGVVAETLPPPSNPQAPSGPVRAARDACRGAAMALLPMRPPSGVRADDRLAFEEALQQCQYVYAVEANAHARLAQVLDRANSALAPDKVALFDAWADVQEANIDALRCASGFIAAARRAGAPFDDFDPARKAARFEPRARQARSAT